MQTNLDIIIKELKSSIDLHNAILSEPKILNTLSTAALNASHSISKGGKIFFAGNGGSFADSQHLAAEFIGTMGILRPSLPAISLGTNSSNTTAISNDFNFNEIFLREFSALATKDDFLFLISTSGNSKNLISVGEFARSIGSNGLILTGKTGGSLAEIFPTIIVPHNRTERIQEVHILLGHIFCQLIENSLGYYE